MANKITLYRKYRPKTFSEVIGQKHIKKTLQNELKRNQISHAYIFAGPHGVGKTTMARLLAKSVNCLDFKNSEPCNKCENCKAVNEGVFLDLIEIDAASHTGVDNIRELIERIKLLPSIGKYKVYIIDEVHMLSRGAFNALLKTLEEPPSHAIFISATTEIFRVPETIISRCERFDFQKLTIKEIESRLLELVKKEKVDIEKNALSLIAKAGRGAVRDSESTLAQIISFGSKRIKEEEVKTFLGITDKSAIIDFTKNLIEKNSSRGVAIINELSEKGIDLEEFLEELIEHLRELLLAKIDENLIRFSRSILSEDDKKTILEQKDKFTLDFLLKSIKLFIIARNEVKYAVYPELPIEIAIMELCPENKEKTENNYRPKEIKGRIERKASQKVQEKQIPEESQKNNLEVKAPVSLKKSQNNQKSLENIKENWNKIIYRVRDKNASLAAFLKSALPVKIEEEKLLVFVPYGFYKERILATKNRHLIEQEINSVTGEKISIDAKSEAEFLRFGLELPKEDDEEIPEEQKKLKDKNSQIISEALNILGGELVD